METGLVVAPFLPGDSLIFLAGAFAAAGALDLVLLFVVMSTAAIAGDSVNYFVGHHFMRRGLHKKIPHIKQEHIDKTYEFYKKHGGKTIVMARFVPIIRTFAPFVAGIGKMRYRNFALYNISGGLLWVFSFLTLGYYLGNIPFVKNNLEIMVVGIILLSILPAIIGFFKSR
jgi:membrane-associated protein